MLAGGCSFGPPDYITLIIDRCRRRPQITRSLIPVIEQGWQVGLGAVLYTPQHSERFTMKIAVASDGKARVIDCYRLTHGIVFQGNFPATHQPDIRSSA